MIPMANPIIVLQKFQQSLNSGAAVDPGQLDSKNYLTLFDQQPSGKRFSYVKIVNRKAQALSIFGEESPFKGVPVFSLGYAVDEEFRGQGLAFEAVNVGIEDLKRKLRSTISSFYVEALIGKTNVHSIKVAEKIFSSPPFKTMDECSGTPSVCFHKLIMI